MNNISVVPDIKKVNRQLIFNLLRTGGPYTRQEVVTETGLSLPTVINNINNLIGDGLVTEVGSIGYTGGRNARTYDIVPQSRTALGLDITKNHVSIVSINLRGDIIYQVRIRKIYQNSEIYYKELAELVNKVICENHINKDNILGIGIGVPGLVTSDNKKIYYGEILKNTGVTSEIISIHLPYPSCLFNDADAACFAEIWKKKDTKNAFYIMLSNNVGGAVVINGSIYYGDDLHSGEIGHTKIVEGGRLCYCGQRGCVDPYLSATVLSSYTQNILTDFFTLLKSEDETALMLFDEYLDKLAQICNNVQLLFNCTVIVGGYMGEFLDPYLGEIKNRASRLNPFSDNANYIQICEYKTQSIAAGAALHYISKFVDSI